MTTPRTPLGDADARPPDGESPSGLAESGSVPRDEAGGFRNRPATAGSIVVCTLVFVGCLIAFVFRSDEPLRALARSTWVIDDSELLIDAGALAAARVWLDQQWWRVASAGLLHGSWLHLGLNMLGLWTVGTWTEKVWGGWRQLALLVVSSIGGCLASLAWAEAPLVVGASAGIFGVAGALAVARAWGSDEIRGALAPISAGSLWFWLIFWLAAGALLPLVFGISLLAQAGHIGGLVIGCTMGFGLSRRKEQRFARLASGVAVGFGLVVLALAAQAPTWRPNYAVFMGAELLERGQYEEAGVQFDVALARAPGDPVLANAVAYSLAEAGVELGRADQLVDEALAVEPWNSDYLDTLGWIRCKQGRTEAGVVVLRMAGAFAEVPPSTRIASWMWEPGSPEIEEHLETCRSVAISRGTGAD